VRGTDVLEIQGRPDTPADLLRAVTPNAPVLLVGAAARWKAAGVCEWLERNRWSSVHADTPERARWLASIQKVSLVLVAGAGGPVWEAVQATRAVTMAPVVVLADPPPSDVVALVAGGVDAVVSPSADPEELFARVVALLRRSDNSWEPGVRYLVAGDLRVDVRARECVLAGTTVHLSPTEYALLTFLMTHPDQALTTEVIVRRVWGSLPSDARNAVRIFVNRLRSKLGDDPHEPRFVASVRGTGYRFVHDVIELGEETEPSADGAPTGSLLESIERLAVRIHGQSSAGSDAVVADWLVAELDASGYADALAVFKVEGDGMRLLADRHMPEKWRQLVRGGVPLQPAFASAHCVMTGEAVQFGDIGEMADRFSKTAEHLVWAGYHACLFVPIMCGDVVWGHLGLLRRARQSFDQTGSSYLKAACAVFALRISAAASSPGSSEPQRKSSRS
jgi:DNA-binding response OmpR family regulator